MNSVKYTPTGLLSSTMNDDISNRSNRNVGIRNAKIRTSDGEDGYNNNIINNNANSKRMNNNAWQRPPSFLRAQNNIHNSYNVNPSKNTISNTISNSASSSASSVQNSNAPSSVNGYPKPSAKGNRKTNWNNASKWNIPKNANTDMRNRLRLERVISGGQSGADRGALEAARAFGISTGGCAPPRFMTSDGPRPELGTMFGLSEMRTSKKISMGKMYAQRSCINVDDADATIAFRLAPSSGTDKTIGYSQTQRWAEGQINADPFQESFYRPCLVITSVNDVDNEATKIARFIEISKAKVVNVAGHRDTTAPIDDFESIVQEIIFIALTKISSDSTA